MNGRSEFDDDRMVLHTLVSAVLLVSLETYSTVAWNSKQQSIWDSG